MIIPDICHMHHMQVSKMLVGEELRSVGRRLRGEIQRVCRSWRRRRSRRRRSRSRRRGSTTKTTTKTRRWRRRKMTRTNTGCL